MAPTDTLEPDTAPQPDEYLPEPDYTEPQDDEPAESLALLGAARTLVTPMAPRDYGEALEFCVQQSRTGGPVWHLLCQKFSRSAPGCPGGFASALAQWFGMPASARHVGGRPGDAPTGSVLFSRSRNPDAAAARFGHALYTARPFGDGRQGGWSTDALRVGWPDKIHPAELYERWNHEYLGWGENMNGLWLDLREPPKPTDTKPYILLGTAVTDIDQLLEHLHGAKDTAKAQEDWADRDAIHALIEDSRALRRKVRIARDQLRKS